MNRDIFNIFYKWLIKLFKWIINLFKWIINLLIWVFEGKKYWIPLLLIFLTFKIFCRNNLFLKEENFIILGLILQIIGVLTVLFGITNKISKYSKKQTIGILNYIRKIPGLKNKYGNLSGTSGGYSMIGNDVELTSKKKPEEDFQAFYSYFKDEIKRLEEKIHKNKIKFIEDLNESKTQLNKFKEIVEKKFNKLNKSIASDNILNIETEIFGIICLILGLILSTIPDYLVLFCS